MESTNICGLIAILKCLRYTAANFQERGKSRGVCSCTIVSKQTVEKNCNELNSCEKDTNQKFAQSSWHSWTLGPPQASKVSPSAFRRVLIPSIIVTRLGQFVDEIETCTREYCHIPTQGRGFIDSEPATQTGQQWTPSMESFTYHLQFYLAFFSSYSDYHVYII